MSAVDTHLAAPPADWRDLSLQAGGRSLIEASAGTGKTWTMAALYLRLLLEQTFTPRQILVATFTDAAASELRERIRQRVLQAEYRARCESTEGTDDSVLQWLDQRWQDAAQRQQDVLRLRLARAELDLAPISTLHGVCARILSDHPFETGRRLSGAELIDEGELLDELLDDYWRELLQREVALAAHEQWLYQRGRDTLRRDTQLLLRPDVEPLVAREEPTRPGLLDTDQGLACLQACLDEPGLFKAKSTLARALPRLIELLAHEGGVVLLTDDEAEDLQKPLSGQITKAFEQDDRVLALRPVLDWLAAWREWLAQDALRRWIDDVRERRRVAMETRHVLSFDAQLQVVHAALHAPDSVLPDLLFQRWPVAMVDEFQDTDGLQYGILDRVYRAADGATRGRLVMIGDPKQAIYRFRGGDVHTYLRAAATADVDARLHLGINRRSTAAYVEACNQWYAACGLALSRDVEHPIRYRPVRAATEDQADTVSPALHVHVWLEPDTHSDSRVSHALQACARHIVALLSDAAQKIEPGDIAVLLPQNSHIEQLRALLIERGVPCVGAGRQSVFQSEWASELQLLLYALHHPRDRRARGAALATRLLGYDWTALRALADQQDRQAELERRFTHWRLHWRQRGVLALVDAVLRECAPHLGSVAQAERAASDLRQLGELLQQFSEQTPGEAQLLQWLDAQRSGEAGSDPDAAGERELRLESDAHRVRLMTLHTSKGLEFPLVLLPLMWAHRQRSEKLALWHAEGRERLQVGWDDEAQARAAQEAQDERFRVLYVALTRARRACHVYALPPDRQKDARSTKAEADPHRSAWDASLDAALTRARAVHADRSPWSALQHLCPAVGIHTEGWAWPEATLPPRLTSSEDPERRIEPPPVPMHRLWSFSRLHQGDQAADSEAPAEDEAPLQPSPLDVLAEPIEEQADPVLRALSHWRGTGFGNAVHRFLQQRPAGTLASQAIDLLQSCLRGYGVATGEQGERGVERLAARLDDCLRAPLWPSPRSVCLADLPDRAQRREMDFHFVLEGAQMSRLRAVCAEHGEASLLPASLPEAALRGLMTGSIDLVFAHEGQVHVLDYKTNRLGTDRREDYRAPALQAAMDASHYRFQALLYSLAVQRYLRQRGGSWVLGEAIYLFLRAVGLDGKEPTLGIWRQRFDADFLRAVDQVFARSNVPDEKGVSP
ncbi:MAG: UvrD-helicase domain-containing protein [Lysobacteraceae bacterium]